MPTLPSAFIVTFVLFCKSSELAIFNLLSSLLSIPVDQTEPLSIPNLTRGFPVPPDATFTSIIECLVLSLCSTKIPTPSNVESIPEPVFTCRGASGAFVPTPTLPSLMIVILAVFLVLNVNASWVLCLPSITIEPIVPCSLVGFASLFPLHPA